MENEWTKTVEKLKTDNEEILKTLKELLEYVESKDSGIEEHDFFTDHDSDQCVLCKAREVVNEHEGR